VSIRLPPPPPPKYAVFERVAPRYDASLTIIHRGWRVFKDKTKLILVSTGDNSTVGTDSEELIRKATETLHITIDSSKWKDLNDNTYDGITLDPGVTVDIATYDLGVSRDMLVMLRASSGASYTVVRVLVSVDCVSYTPIIGLGGGLYWGFARATARCLRLQGYNGYISAININIYTFEAYPVTRELTVTTPGARFLNIVAHGYTQLLEVIEL